MGAIYMSDLIGTVIAFIFGGALIIVPSKILINTPADKLVGFFMTFGLILVTFAFVFFMYKFFKTDKIKDATGDTFAQRSNDSD